MTTIDLGVFFKRQRIKAAIPVKSTRHDKSKLYKKEHFKIDLKNKKVTCPADKELKYLGFNDKRLIYEFVGTTCNSCKLKTQCTTGQARRSSIHMDYVLKEKAMIFNKTRRYKAIFKKRSCIERVIGEAKRFHGMFRAKFRSLWKLKIQFYLTAIAINLKRIATFFIKQQNIGAISLKTGP